MKIRVDLMLVGRLIGSKLPRDNSRGLKGSQSRFQLDIAADLVLGLICIHHANIANRLAEKFLVQRYSLIFG